MNATGRFFPIIVCSWENARFRNMIGREFSDARGFIISVINVTDGYRTVENIQLFTVYLLTPIGFTTRYVVPCEKPS